MLQLLEIIFAALLILKIVVSLRNTKTRATGEVCIEAGIWRCTVCGELIPMDAGFTFPECEEGDVKWEYAGKKPE